MIKCEVLRHLIAFTMLGMFVHMQAQDNVRIHYKNGTHADISITEIDSLTFVSAGSSTTVEAELTGSWLWGNVGTGYYELLVFNKDYTYTGYDNYFTYGFDTMTYGFFSQYGTMLTLWSNGFGYQYRYNWFITGLTENALSVMTKMGPFTYYRLQPETLRLKVGESLTSGEDEYIFADGVVARVEGNKLTGIARGETYIIKMTASTQLNWAYKVVVE